MKYKKIMLILITAIFLVSIASVCAADANDTMVASENTNQMDLSSNNVIVEDSLQTSEENTTLTQANDAESDSQNLTKSYYSYTGGDTIEIKNSGVINGNGAVIDMAGSINMRAFTVSASDVTIRNITIKNANYNGDGGAVYFDESGDVTNCNFAGNTASGDGGAICMSFGSVENCNFTNNKATGDDSYGGAVYFYNQGTVTNCNFAGNNATGEGGAVYFSDNGNVTNCNFTNNKATGDDSYGGAVFFYNQGTVTNCNFTNNVAGEWGGAVIMSSGTVTNCIFVNNVAGEWGGAILSVQYLGVT